MNQKLASSSDAKYGKASGTPLVRSYASSHHQPSFAAHPVSTRTRSATKHVAGYHSSADPHTPAASRQPTAPSFAAVPVWQMEQSPAQQSRSAPSPFQRDSEMADAASPSRISSQELKSDPVYQYAKMGRRNSTGESMCRCSLLTVYSSLALAQHSVCPHGSLLSVCLPQGGIAALACMQTLSSQSLENLLYGA